MKHRLLYILILVACRLPVNGQNQDFYLGLYPTFNYLFQKEQSGGGIGVLANKPFRPGQSVTLGLDWINFKSQGIWNSNPNEDILGKRNSFSLVSLQFLLEQKLLKKHKLQPQLGAGFCLNYWHLYERSFNGLVSDPEYTETRKKIVEAGILGLIGLSYQWNSRSAFYAATSIEKDDAGYAIFSTRIGYRRQISRNNI